MRSLYTKLSRYALLRAAVYILFGLLLIFAPNAVTHIIVYIIAAYLAVMGILSIIGALRSGGDSPFTQYDFILGVLMVILSLIAFIFSQQLISLLPIFFGVLIVLGGASYLLQAISLKGSNAGPVAVLWVLAIVFIAAGILIIFNPFQTILLLFQAFGIALALYGIGEIVTYLLFRHEIGNEIKGK